MERGGDRRGGERREESVPIVPVLRNDHCSAWQFAPRGKLN